MIIAEGERGSQHATSGAGRRPTARRLLSSCGPANTGGKTVHSVNAPRHAGSLLCRRGLVDEPSGRQLCRLSGQILARRCWSASTIRACIRCGGHPIATAFHGFIAIETAERDRDEERGRPFGGSGVGCRPLEERALRNTSSAVPASTATSWSSWASSVGSSFARTTAARSHMPSSPHPTLRACRQQCGPCHAARCSVVASSIGLGTSPAWVTTDRCAQKGFRIA